MNSETTKGTGFYEFLAWLDSNKKALIATFILLVIVGFGIATYRWQREQAEIAANEALFQLRSPMSSADKAPPPAASEYLKIAENYRSTEAAERALLLAAGAFFAEGKYSEAQAQFNRLMQEHSNQLMASTAAYGFAASLEAQGKSDEALTAYQTVASRHASSSLVDDSRLATARIYENKKQPELALKVYEDMTRTNMMSGSSAEALSRKQYLLSKHPELAKPNAAPLDAAASLISTNLPALPTNAPASGPDKSPK
jgi:predicted negative regulator of RcsB-dependent stress response